MMKLPQFLFTEAMIIFCHLLKFSFGSKNWLGAKMLLFDILFVYFTEVVFSFQLERGLVRTGVLVS